MFLIGDLIAHPLHGAGIIESIVNKRINGADREYYVLKLPVGDMVVMVPIEGCENIGVRHIISKNEAEEIIRNFNSIEVSNCQNWNKRYRENMSKIKSGKLFEVAEVVKSLMQRDAERGLSTGERKCCIRPSRYLFQSLLLFLILITLR